MGFRFYRRVQILPGVRLNLSRKGVSTSVGVRGAHVTFGHGQMRETVGIPGTGISYTTKVHSRLARTRTVHRFFEHVIVASLLLLAVLRIWAVIQRWHG